MDSNETTLVNQWESLRRLVAGMERIFDTVKDFSERTGLFVQVVQRFLGTLLDSDLDIDAELLFPTPFTSHYDPAIKDRIKTACSTNPPLGANPHDQSHLSANDSVSYTDLLGGFQEHNRQLREMMVTGKSNVTSLKRSLEPLFEALARNGNPKDIQLKNDQLKMKVGSLKAQLAKASEELAEFKLQKRLADETQKSALKTSVLSSPSDPKLGSCCEKYRQLIEQKNTVIAEMMDRAEATARENLEARRSIGLLETQIRLMQDDFIALYKTVQERLALDSTAVRLERVATLESTLTHYKEAAHARKKSGQMFASQEWPANAKKIVANNSAHFERRDFAPRTPEKADNATERDSLDKERPSKHRRIYSFSQQALIDEEEQEDNLGSTLPDPRRNPEWTGETALAEKLKRETAFFATNGHQIIDEAPQMGESFGQNKTFTVNLRPDSLSRLHELERPTPLTPGETLGARLFEDLFPKEAKTGFGASQEEEQHSFVEYSSKHSSAKEIETGGYKSGRPSPQAVEKVVLLKETGMNRIEAADFARILFSQNQLIDLDKSQQVLEKSIGKFEANTIFGTLNV